MSRPSVSVPPRSAGGSQKWGGNANVAGMPGNVEEVTASENIILGLCKYYRDAIKPLEMMYKFDKFHSPHLTDTDFQAKPMVLLIGQYSVGKTSFINYLMEKDFQGMNIGPEPTTDKFHAVFYDKEERVIPGNALAAMNTQPFTALQKYGMSFLNRFEGATCNSPVLEKLTFIDSPGVLSGDKQRIGRAYEFTEVIRWFAERADRILLLFDAHKLDISDELKSVIECLQNQDDKIKCILNKADSVSRSQLMRVYGSLMWSLGRVIKTPEVTRVYCGSFWDKPHANKETESLLKLEEADLIADLRSLPRNSAVRKVNELVKRARMAKVHAYLCAHLAGQFGWFGKDAKKKELSDNLLTVFKTVQQQHNLAIGDFPDVNKFRQFMQHVPVEDMPKIDKNVMLRVDKVLSEVIPDLLRLLPSQQSINLASPGLMAVGGMGGMGQQQLQARVNPNAVAPGEGAKVQRSVFGGAGEEEGRGGGGRGGLGSPATTTTAGGGGAGDGMGANPFDDDEDAEPAATWCVPQQKQVAYQNTFFGLKLVSGKLSGAAAKDVLGQSGLSKPELKQVWVLADMDKDGYLDVDEFIVAMHLIELRQTRAIEDMPDVLKPEEIPPTKRHLFQ